MKSNETIQIWVLKINFYHSMLYVEKLSFVTVTDKVRKDISVLYENLYLDNPVLTGPYILSLPYDE